MAEKRIIFGTSDEAPLQGWMVEWQDHDDGLYAVEFVADSPNPANTLFTWVALESIWKAGLKPCIFFGYHSEYVDNLQDTFEQFGMEALDE